MAEKLGGSRKTLSKIVNKKGSVTPEMVLRLSRFFGATLDFWMNLQKKHDLWSVKKLKTILENKRITVWNSP